MDWIQVIVIVGVFTAFFVYVLNRIDTKLDNFDRKFEGKFDNLQKEISNLNAKMSNIEGQITQMTRPKIVRIKNDEDLKEN